jgi:hypothetical protein
MMVIASWTGKMLRDLHTGVSMLKCTSGRMLAQSVRHRRDTSITRPSGTVRNTDPSMSLSEAFRLARSDTSETPYPAIQRARPISIAAFLFRPIHTAFVGTAAPWMLKIAITNPALCSTQAAIACHEPRLLEHQTKVAILSGAIR